MTPNPTTATRSQAMRHSVGAPLRHIYTSRKRDKGGATADGSGNLRRELRPVAAKVRYRRRYGRGRLQSATVVATAEVVSSPLRSSLRPRSSPVRYGRRYFGTCAYARVRCEPTTAYVRLLRLRMLWRDRFAVSATPPPCACLASTPSLVRLVSRFVL